MTYPGISADWAPQGSRPGLHICMPHAGPVPVGNPMSHARARQTLPAVVRGMEASKATRVVVDGVEKRMLMLLG